ncbi:MAG: Rpn family recombination-promoting nuclease/putative transposase, partial [Planctomycetaceae bacterium]|nr:Rpn family recombination-promoting nuclease/putative transposase [Planctomycetaceae bacterium]
GEETKVPWDYALKGVYMICILDNIMFPEEQAKNIVMEQIKIVRQKAETVLTDKWEAVTIELPKFTKTENELETVMDKWFYSLKNMEKLPERPEKLNEKIFDELYENAKITRLKKEDMKAYNKSVLEYDDVISSLRYVEERVRKETTEKVEKETTEKVRKETTEKVKKETTEKVKKETTEKVEKETTEKVRKEDRIEFVRNCHKYKANIEQIVAFTGLTKKEVSDIIAKL